MARYSRNDQAGVELPKGKLDRETLNQALELFRYLRPYRGRFSAAVAALFASSLLSLGNAQAGVGAVPVSSSLPGPVQRRRGGLVCLQPVEFVVPVPGGEHH